MARYKLNMQVAHRQCLIDLFNNDNAATLAKPLTLDTTDIINELAVPSSSGIPRQYTARLVNRSSSTDYFDIYYNKVNLTDVVSMSPDSFDEWYNPFGWTEADDLTKARSAFYKACRDVGLEPSLQLENVGVSRVFYNDLWCIKITCTSFTFQPIAYYPIPWYLQDVVVTVDVGSIPIPEQLVA